MTPPATKRGVDRLWAPWRGAYIERVSSQTRKRAATEPCLFCRVAARATDRADLVIARRPHALLMLNRFPYSPAHLMVAVRRHAGRITELSAAEREDFLALAALAERVLEAEYQPHGMNLGANYGRVAGAGFPGHLHLHLVPRWDGDTNFMPVIGETRVLPESLGRTWTRLRRAIREDVASARDARTPGAGRGARRGAKRGAARG